MKLKGKLIIMSLAPLAALAILIIIFSNLRISNVISNVVREDIQASARLQAELIQSYDGDFSVEDNGDLVKGQHNITQETDVMDSLLDSSKIALTIFYGDTRYSTSIVQDGERILGTQAGQAVVDEVLHSGNEYFASNVDILNEKYYGYYVPILDKDNTPVGMVFAGKSQTNVSKEINSILGFIAVVTLVVSIICVITTAIFSQTISKRLTNGVNALEHISDGDLLVELNEAYANGKDETADIVRAVIKLKSTIGDIVGQIIADSSHVHLAATKLKAGAVTASDSIQQVEHAMEEVALAATAQASDTQNATNEVHTIGQRIDEINTDVQRLNENSDKMEQNGMLAKNTLKELESINAEVQNSIDTIYAQTNTTNESAQKISEAISLITSIAEETNLLSLNASIEAARAGEQGRGFAVVASQIQKLAEQSNVSAQQINQCTQSLMEDSQNAVATMDSVKETMARQCVMVEKTDQVFHQVLEGIQDSRTDVSKISDSTKALEASKVSITDIIQNLSAVSEEYAASTQETSSAATQVSSIVQDITDSSVDMQQLAAGLKDSVDYFKLYETTRPET